MSDQESAVIVAVPEAEDAVRSWRARLDPAAGWGVPAHITVLYPFLPVHELDSVVLRSLAEVVAEVAAFDCVLTRVQWFGNSVLWLEPDPAEAFGRLTRGVWRSFPQCSPYGGRHAELIPHLTVGDSASRDEMTAAARSVSAMLPIHVRVTHARLICGSTKANSWRTVQELPLGAPHG